MSENKRTIEERYEYLQKYGYFRDEDFVALLDDLMAEREKLKERIEELEKEAAEWEDIRTRRMGG